MLRSIFEPARRVRQAKGNSTQRTNLLYKDSSLAYNLKGYYQGTQDCHQGKGRQAQRGYKKVTFYCKGVCQRYKPEKRKKGRLRYLVGNKRCNVCEAWIKWDGRRCPCCSNVLRITPRMTKYRRKLRDALLVRQ